MRILYDDNAIYIGAYLYDDPSEYHGNNIPPAIICSGRTLTTSPVFLDTYKDRQNAFQFLVTARNVQTDARVSANYNGEDGTYGDVSWDAVWDSKVAVPPRWLGS